MIQISKLITIVLVLVSVNIIFAQEVVEKISLGHTLKISSSVLNEDRNVYVYLPQGYYKSEKKYPVIYLLDGRGHFHHGSGIVEFLSTGGMMPQCIVVAIPNIARQRDFTPTTEEGRENTGGAESFINFLQHELLPVIDKAYRTHNYRILFGHSLTGMFSVYTFVTHPHLFNAYIAASPYLQYDDDFTLKKAKELLNKETVKNKVLYLTLGDEPPYVDGLKKLSSILKDLNGSGLDWKYVIMEQENHRSIPHKTIYDGLEYIFSGWQIPAEKANDLTTIQKHYSSLSQKYGFTVNPQEFLLNRLGYQIMANKEYHRAIKVFQANAELYPDSDNVYDSLGEAYEKSGKLELAAKNYTIATEKGAKIESRNLPIYKKNLERVQKLLK